MIKNIVIIVQTIIIMVIAGWLIIKYQQDGQQTTKTNAIGVSDNPYAHANLQFEIIPAENNSWGYKILLEGSPMIIQTNKPGLPGNEGFKTKVYAQKVAELVISKIQKGEMPPTVTIEELSDLGVLK